MGKQWKQWLTLFFWVPKSLQMVTAAMKLKDTPWKESYDQPRQHIKKQRHYFAKKGSSSQGCGLSSRHIWMWVLDYKKSWVLKFDAFGLWCWWRLLWVCWTARRSILKEISHECSLEGMILNLKLQYFGHLLRGADHLKIPWFWERLRAGGEGDDWCWDGWMASLTQWTWVWVNSGCLWWTGRPDVPPSLRSQRVGDELIHTLSFEGFIPGRVRLCLFCLYIMCLLMWSFVTSQP